MVRVPSLVTISAMAFTLNAFPAMAQIQEEDDGTTLFTPGEDEEPDPATVKPAPAPAAPAQPTAEPAPATPTTAGPALNPIPQNEVKMRVRGKTPDRVFGTYRVRVSYNRPTFDDGMEFYDEAYGDPAAYPSFAADWFAWDWYVTLGLRLSMGYYTDDGKALRVKSGVAKAKEDLEEDDVEEDPNGKTSLTLIPLQAAIAAEITPFDKKWLVLDGYIGVERIYWQEVRTGGGSSTTSSASIMLAEEETESNDDALTNKGWKNGTVIGAAANILLNPLDEQGAASMRGSMGLGFIYLSPFMEIVRTTSKDGVSFGRKIFGVGFTFETVK